MGLRMQAHLNLSISSYLQACTCTNDATLERSLAERSLSVGEIFAKQTEIYSSLANENIELCIVGDGKQSPPAYAGYRLGPWRRSVGI